MTEQRQMLNAGHTFNDLELRLHDTLSTLMQRNAALGPE